MGWVIGLGVLVAISYLISLRLHPFTRCPAGQGLGTPGRPCGFIYGYGTGGAAGAAAPIGRNDWAPGWASGDAASASPGGAAAARDQAEPVTGPVLLAHHDLTRPAPIRNPNTDIRAAYQIAQNTNTLHTNSGGLNGMATAVLAGGETEPAARVRGHSLEGHLTALGWPHRPAIADQYHATNGGMSCQPYR